MLKRYYERGDPPVAVAGHFEQVTDEEDQGIQAEDEGWKYTDER